MTVKKLFLEGYRNIDGLEILPDENVNIIFGENAQGKTNIIEGLWLFTGCKSFRTNKDSELVGFEKNFAKISLDFFANGREQNAKILIEDKRKAFLNGVSLSSSSKLIGEFNAIVFSPLHLSLVKDGPANRRRFLDTALCQLKPNYANCLLQYNHTLQQRNALLKDVPYHSELLDTLEVWEDRLCSLGAMIIFERLNYVKQLSSVTSEIYAGLSGKKECLRIDYKGSDGVYDGTKENVLDYLKTRLKQTRKEDLIQKSTSIGPHRDDLDIKIDCLSARNFGSQGQQRSAAIALKLGEADIVYRFTGEKPIALLDDVMSELDINRQDYILNHTQDWQVFITCCEPSTILRLCKGKTFEIEKGKLKGD